MRAVAVCKKPVVSAVGHETDVTLCDLAADLRAPTPSAAAECVVPLRSELAGRVAAMRAALEDAARARLMRERSRLSVLCAQLAAGNPRRAVAMQRERLSALRVGLDEAAVHALAQRRTALVQKRRELELLSPYAVLSRGYAVVRRGETVVESAAALRPGDEARIRFQDGETRVRVLGDGGEATRT